MEGTKKPVNMYQEGLLELTPEMIEQLKEMEKKKKKESEKKDS